MQVKFAVIASALLLSVLAACGGGGGGGGGSSPPLAVTLRSIAVTPSNQSLALNFDQQFTATGTYSDNSIQNITTLVSWSSSSAVVATVDMSTGLATPAGGASSGQATTITASSSGLTATSTLTLSTAATLNSIAVTPQNRSVALNSTLPLIATGTYSNSRTKNLTNSVTWSSGSLAVATANSSTGLITPASGATIGQSAVITATYGGFTPTTTIRLAGATFSLASVSDPLAAQQWGMRNTAQKGYADTAGIANTGLLGTDINVDSVYSTYGYTGWGVTVAVVDTGLEIAHEDLSANVVSGGSWDFTNTVTDTDPTSSSTTGDHGTSVSGLIAMAMNGKGGIGVAPNAQLKGFNYLADGVAPTAANQIVSLGGLTASPNSSDVFIFNQSYGTENKAVALVNTDVEAQYASGTTTLRAGKGALYVKSAGNGFISFGTAGCAGATGIGVSCQNANFDPYNTLPYNIVMAALNAKGTKSSYSTAGSAIWASTPGGEYGNNSSIAAGSGVSFDPAMVTTDQSGCTNGYSRTAATSSLFDKGGNNLASININCNYTNSMNGTSSAAPMMSGVIALILEANPALTWREVKDILARTAVQVDASKTALSEALSNGNYVAEQAWVTNAAGRKFHNWYGFGAVNAKAAVDMARTYVSGSLGTFANTGWITSGAISLPIPDNSITGVSLTLTVPALGTSSIVEAVQLKVTTTITPPGTVGYVQDLGIELTSPSGTKSILKNIRDGLSGSSTLTNMVLASNAFYGETSTGSWTVKVVDGWVDDTQTLTNVEIRVYGH